MALVYFPLCSVLLQRSPPPPEETRRRRRRRRRRGGERRLRDSARLGHARRRARRRRRHRRRLAQIGGARLRRAARDAARRRRRHRRAARAWRRSPKRASSLGAVALYVFFATAAGAAARSRGRCFSAAAPRCSCCSRSSTPSTSRSSSAPRAPHFERPLLLAASNANIGGRGTPPRSSKARPGRRGSGRRRSSSATWATRWRRRWRLSSTARRSRLGDVSWGGDALAELANQVCAGPCLQWPRSMSMTAAQRLRSRRPTARLSPRRCPRSRRGGPQNLRAQQPTARRPTTQRPTAGRPTAPPRTSPRITPTATIWPR